MTAEEIEEMQAASRKMLAAITSTRADWDKAVEDFHAAVTPLRVLDLINTRRTNSN